MEFRNHILDNGFHIMPFYKKSAIYDVLKSANIVSKLKLAIVDKIAFFDGNFHTYPKGIGDILKMSLIPLKSRFSLLKILLPMAQFTIICFVDLSIFQSDLKYQFVKNLMNMKPAIFRFVFQVLYFMLYILGFRLDIL